MSIKAIIKKHLFAVIALVLATGSFFLMSFHKTNKAMLSEVTIYFHGDPTEKSEVEEESNWKEQTNGESCNTGNNRACSMKVEDTDLIGPPGFRELNPTQIQLDAEESAPSSGTYVPIKAGGSSSTDPEIFNRN